MKINWKLASDRDSGLVKKSKKALKNTFSDRQYDFGWQMILCEDAKVSAKVVFVWGRFSMYFSWVSKYQVFFTQIFKCIYKENDQ